MIIWIVLAVVVLFATHYVAYTVGKVRTATLIKKQLEGVVADVFSALGDNASDDNS